MFNNSSWKRVLLPLLAMAAVAVLFSCEKKDPNGDRDEYIRLYRSFDDEEPVSSIWVGVKGGTVKFHVRSNVEFEAAWQDDKDTQWGNVKEVSSLGGDKYDVTVDFKAIHSYPYYTRRTGNLMLFNKEKNLGNFVNVHQGLVTRLASDMSWSAYGTSDPRKDDGVLLSKWSTTNKNRGWTSTPAEGADEAYLLAKNGYLQIGDSKGHGADLICPFITDIQNDSLAVVSFRAVAPTGMDGVKDANKFTVEVIGGGVIRDQVETGGTKVELEAPWYDPFSDGFPGNMWDGSYFMIGLVSTPKSPFTQNTRIRITAGEISATPAAKPSRLFVDNFYVRRIWWKDEDNNDEDIFALNGGVSGPDHIFDVTE